ncbi:MAG: YkgJ family cysteine cluster protein [Methylococcaceae bacterium]|nr:YkgJ family cysteine cluster protein [Methylococcaceae bacterium]
MNYKQSLEFQCRPDCGACCIAPSITSALPGMPMGKPAGVACIQLLADFRCAVFNQPCRPGFCAGLKPAEEMCGANREQAMLRLAALEIATQP